MDSRAFLCVRFAEEWKAQGEVNALRASLKTHASVKRDGVFAIIESSQVCDKFSLISLLNALF